MEKVYWKSDDWTTDETQLQYKDKVYALYIGGIIDQYKENMPVINSIEIETINRCNNDCSFCPVSRENDIREYKKMSEELFYKIIDELSEMGYSGYLSLFSNNEPLLDTRIFMFLEYAREKLPKAKHAMYTNGMLLTQEKYQRLTSLLDYLVIDNYNDCFEISESIKELDGLEEGTNCKVRVEIRKKTQVLSNRGGLAPNKKAENKYHSGCILPFMQMVIRPDGRVSRCCQDAYGNMTLADLSIESIVQAWNSKAYKHMRTCMIEEGREKVKGCAACDLFGLHNYFPIEWADEYTNSFISVLKKQKKQGKQLVFIGNPAYAEIIIDMLKFHGIYIDSFSEVVDQVESEVFYILQEFDWNILYHFQPEDAGEKYIVYENPNAFSLQEEKAAHIKGVSIKEIYAAIKSAERKDKLVIFGAGKNAQRLNALYGFHVKYYIDNNQERIGTMFLEREILGVKSVLADAYLVLVSANDFVNIRKQLIEMGVKKENILDGNRLII